RERRGRVLQREELPADRARADRAGARLSRRARTRDAGAGRRDRRRRGPELDPARDRAGFDQAPRDRGAPRRADARRLRDRRVRPHVRDGRRGRRPRDPGARDHRLRDRGCLRELFSFHGVRRRGRCGERRLEGGRPVRRGTTGLAALPRRSRGRGARSALPRAHRRVRTRGPDPARDPPVRAGRGSWRRRARRALPDPPHVPVSPALTALGVIPARLASTRLPRKVLRDVAGKPLITPRHVALLVAPFRERPGAQVTTLKIRLLPDEADNPNVNKVVCATDGRALYFSKYPVPYDRDGRGVARFRHIGLYAYRRAALEAFHLLPPSPLELAEKLEQLRFLENGIPITVVETDEPTIGVDTEADLRAVEAHFARRA